MKLSEKMLETLSELLNLELASSYLYYAMGIAALDNNFDGYANWFEKRFQEEARHANGVSDYITERREVPILHDIKRIEFEWESPVATAEAAFKHEQEVSQAYIDLMDQAIEEDDYATVSFARRYIDEQVEEEALFDDILQKFKFCDGKISALIALDAWLATQD